MSIVVGLLRTAVAVDLDCHREFGTVEIDNILIQRLLTGELDPGESLVLKYLDPQLVLSRRRRSSILACLLGERRVVADITPLTPPLSGGKRRGGRSVSPSIWTFL